MTVNQNVYTAIIKGNNNVSIDWNFTKNVLHLFVLMLYVQAILFFLLIHPLFFFINQHFIKQYTNTGSYYCNFFSINVTIINNLFQEFTCLSITKWHTGTFILDSQDMHYNHSI